jgi:hypothetical protein
MGTPPANRTLRGRIWSPAPSQTATYMTGVEDHPYHRKESHLLQRPSHGRVSSSNRWCMAALVWLTGIAPATSWTPTTRSASELQPVGLIGRDCTCDLADPNGAPYCSATIRKRGRYRNRTRPSRHPPFEGGRHPVRLLPAITPCAAVEGIGPSVRSRLTNGLVAFLAPRVVASPEAPRSQSTESNRHAGGNEPPRCPARTAFELRERAHRMGRPRKRRATTLVSVTGIEPVFPV